MKEQTVPAKLKIRRILEIKRALNFVWQSAKGWTMANGVLLVAQGMLPLLPLYLMKLMVDAVTAGLMAPDKRMAFRPVAFLIALMAAVTLHGTLIRSIDGVVSEAQALAVTIT
jgi:ATP-binding cassette subfamily B protein